MNRLCWSVVLLVAACNGPPTQGTTPPTTDTDTGEPHILPVDSFPLPQDTAPEVIPDLTPDHLVILQQRGQWTLGNTSAPWGNISEGTLTLQEFVDELDTATPVYECDVEYSLTGTEVTNHDCPSCDFVMAVEHYLTSGDPSACHDPDAPLDGAIRHLGYDGGTNKILFDYHGTGVWLPWYDADRVQQTVDFDWTATLAIEILDSADP